MKKEKTPQEQAAYEAKRAAQRRQWAIAHPEQTRRYGREFYKRNQEKRKAYSREYNRQHREERHAYAREYYRRKKAENPNYVRELNQRDKERRLAKAAALAARKAEARRLARHQYYMENRLEICRRLLTEYAYRSIERIKALIPERVEAYLRAYPFEECGDRLIRAVLFRHFQLRSRQAEYEDCYEAGMLAYLYSIHRCAVLECSYTVPYIRKMVRIYVNCALVVYHDTRELCRKNQLSEVRLDADPTGRRY